MWAVSGEWSQTVYLFSRKPKNSITKFGPSTINTLPTNLTCLSQTEEYWPSGHAVLGPYCLDIGPIIPSAALALGQEEIIIQFLTT